MPRPDQIARAERIRDAQDIVLPYVAGTPAAVNSALAMIRDWRPGTADQPASYTKDQDVRLFGGNPYMCCQTHTHHGEPDWDPAHYKAAWLQYHGTSTGTARPWIAPTGAHDVYKVGEYMLYTDQRIYRCKQDTNFSPTDYPQAWEQV